MTSQHSSALPKPSLPQAAYCGASCSNWELLAQADIGCGTSSYLPLAGALAHSAPLLALLPPPLLLSSRLHLQVAPVS